MKELIAILLCLSLTGCASMGSKYYETTPTTIIKEGNMESISKETAGALEEHGYKHVDFADNERGFWIFEKKPVIKSFLVGSSDAWRIKLKMTRIDEGKVRIDLERGSYVPMTNNEVDKDIKKIAEALRD